MAILDRLSDDARGSRQRYFPNWTDCWHRVVVDHNFRRGHIKPLAPCPPSVPRGRGPASIAPGCRKRHAVIRGATRGSTRHYSARISCRVECTTDSRMPGATGEHVDPLIMASNDGGFLDRERLMKSLPNRAAVASRSAPHKIEQWPSCTERPSNHRNSNSSQHT